MPCSAAVSKLKPTMRSARSTMFGQGRRAPRARAPTMVAASRDLAGGTEVGLDPGPRTTGSEVAHMSSLGIERPAHSFDHHHGLLQHDEFGAGLHVEQSRDLEQQRQELGHGDLVGRPGMDRLADGPDRLSEVLHPVPFRYVAGLEMDPRHMQVVARDEAVEDLGQEAPLPRAEPPHDAEIDGREAPRARRRRGCPGACRRGTDPSRMAWRRKAWITVRPSSRQVVAT